MHPVKKSPILLSRMVSVCAPLCVAKSLCSASRFARLAGELGGADLEDNLLEWALKLPSPAIQNRLSSRPAPPRTGSPGPFGPGTPEKSEKSLERVPRVTAPESQKSPKRV